MEKGVELLNQALAIAQKFDEQTGVASVLYMLANRIKHEDLPRGLDLLMSARKLSESLGYKLRLGMINYELGHIMALRGELDAAIQYQSDYIACRNSLGLASDFIHSVIAMYLNQMGKGTEALEEAKIGASVNGPVFRLLSYTRAQMTWALINVGRLEEAKDALAETNEIALKSGDSNEIVYAQFVEGILDKAENNFDGAISNFTEVLKFYQESPSLLWENLCYLKLTEIEIDMLPKDSLKEKFESSGPWMKKLEANTQKNDLPGIAAQSLLLKAKLHHRQGQYDAVRKILKEVQKISEAPSMKYLNDMLISMFPDIIVS